MLVITMVVAMVVIAIIICDTEPPAPDKPSFCPAPVGPHITHCPCAYMKQHQHKCHLDSLHMQQQLVQEGFCLAQLPCPHED